MMAVQNLSWDISDTILYHIVTSTRFFLMMVRLNTTTTSKMMIMNLLLTAYSSILLLASFLQLPSSSFAFAPILTTTTCTSTKQQSRGHELHASTGGGSFAMNPAQTAVIMCKFQNDFASEGGKIYETVKEVMDATNMLENSKKFVNLSRKLGCQIVHCPLSTQPGKSCVTSMPFGVVERVKSAAALQHDAWGGQICDDMQPVAGDLVIPKYGMCAFQTTNLHAELQARGIKNVIVAGFLTNGSVESTIRTAYEKCYNVYALTDCCAACTMEEHVFSIQQNFGMFATLSNGAEMLQALMTD